MKTQIKIENLKCHGCANTITKAIKKFDEVDNVVVNVPESIVEIQFQGDEQHIEKFKAKLVNLGYPEVGENSNISVVKSYVSCAIGRVKKTDSN